MSRLFISIIGALLLFLTACSNEEPQLEKKNLIVDPNVPKLRYPDADAMATVDYMMREFYEKNAGYYPGYTSNEYGGRIIADGVGKTLWSAYCGAMQEAVQGFYMSINSERSLEKKELISINSERSLEKNELTPLRRISPNLEVSWRRTVMEKTSGSSGSSQKKNRSIDRQIDISLFDSKIRCSFKDGIYSEYSDLENSADLIREMKKEGHGILKIFKGFDGMGTPLAFGITIFIRFKQ